MTDHYEMKAECGVFTSSEVLMQLLDNVAFSSVPPTPPTESSQPPQQEPEGN